MSLTIYLVRDDPRSGKAVRRVKDSHRGLGLWSIRRALIAAFTTAVVLLVGAWFFVTWLIGSPSRAPVKPLDTGAQLDLLRLVFALVAGTGALVALVTTYRRQRVEEIAQAHAEHDATERRVTELYGQAVEQLGHDKAAVRLGGLYSLERLAQDHPQHRQTVVDVICAYLRMPFAPPRAFGEQRNVPDGTQVDTNHQPASDDTQAHQELQVRLAAQRLLANHLRIPITDQHNTDKPPPRPDTYWDGIAIDLTNAHLVNVDFTECHIHKGDFTQTQFSGQALFYLAWFSGDIWFSGARFNGEAGFFGARFNGDTFFDKVRFNGEAAFLSARFSEDAEFDLAQFSKDALFYEAQFSGKVNFDEAQFSERITFAKARFSIGAIFGGTQFKVEPDFSGATASPVGHYRWPSPWGLDTPKSQTETVRLVRRQHGS